MDDIGLPRVLSSHFWQDPINRSSPPLEPDGDMQQLSQCIVSGERPTRLQLHDFYEKNTKVHFFVGNESKIGVISELYLSTVTGCSRIRLEGDGRDFRLQDIESFSAVVERSHSPVLVNSESGNSDSDRIVALKTDDDAILVYRQTLALRVGIFAQVLEEPLCSHYNVNSVVTIQQLRLFLLWIDGLISIDATNCLDLCIAADAFEHDELKKDAQECIFKTIMYAKLNYLREIPLRGQKLIGGGFEPYEPVNGKLVDYTTILNDIEKKLYQYYIGIPGPEKRLLIDLSTNGVLYPQNRTLHLDCLQEVTPDRSAGRVIHNILRILAILQQRVVVLKLEHLQDVDIPELEIAFEQTPYLKSLILIWPMSHAGLSSAYACRLARAIVGISSLSFFQIIGNPALARGRNPMLDILSTRFRFNGL